MSKKITDLTALAAIEADDYFVIQEDSSGITKKMKIAAILTYLTANLDDITSDLDIGAATTRRVSPGGTAVNEDDGSPRIEGSGALDIDGNVTESTWESVGPTTPGTADNIWTALDGVPTDADWIRVRFYVYGETSSGGSGLHQLSLYARSGASAVAAGTATKIAYTCADVGSGTGDGGNIGEATIPVSSLEFDVYWESTFTASTAVLFYAIVGWGFNPTS